MSEEMKHELNDRDRRYLQRTVAQPGYKVLEKLIGGFVRTMEDKAFELSKIDPLRNSETIIQAWAYAATAKLFEQNLAGAVQFELDKLNKPILNPKSPEEKIARHRAVVLGELDVEPEDDNDEA